MIPGTASWPGPHPRLLDADILLAGVRDAFPVDHGRIDLAGEPAFVLHPVIQVGALVSYELSAEDRFQEQVRALGRRAVQAPPARGPARQAVPCGRGRAGPARRPERPDADLSRAGAPAHRRRRYHAPRGARRSGPRRARQAERGRAAAYYADAIAGIETRLATAQPTASQCSSSGYAATREEEARRLAEIAEKYEARHFIRPYRLHVMRSRTARTSGCPARDAAIPGVLRLAAASRGLRADAVPLLRWRGAAGGRAS